MNYPALHMEIAESAQGTPRNKWPATLNFPNVHKDMVFAIPKVQPPRSVQVMRVFMDLNKLIDVLKPTIH